MKRNWKKMSAILLAGMMVLAGCTQSESATSTGDNGASSGEATESKTLKIGVTQIVTHEALDAAREGFKERLAELGIEAEYIEKNAQGDVSNALLIANGFVDDGVDMILGIATPTAQAAQKAIENTEIPMVFTAVSDPVGAGLVESNENGSGNITGVTDIVSDENLTQLLELYKEVKPEAKSIGVIYNTGEINSQSQVNDLKRVAPGVGLDVVEVGISDIASIDQAIEQIESNADGMILITDNMIASAIGLIVEKTNQKGIVTVSAVSAYVENGSLLSVGISYRQLGIQAADMAKKILIDGVKAGDLAVENSKEYSTYVNKTTAELLGVDINSDSLKNAIIVE